MDTNTLLDSAVFFVKGQMKNNDPSHDWHHVERVWKNAVYICGQEKLLNPHAVFDQEIVELAALFHDLVDYKYDYGENKDLSTLATEKLEPFFSKHSYPDEKRKQIIFIILNVSWRKELENKDVTNGVPVELKIIRDSDRLESIGAIGVARCFSYAGTKNQPLYVANTQPVLNMTAEQYNKQTLENNAIAFNFFYEKLVLIRDKMQTVTGRKLAEQRHEFMLAFLQQFKRELTLNE